MNKKKKMLKIHKKKKMLKILSEEQISKNRDNDKEKSISIGSSSKVFHKKIEQDDNTERTTVESKNISALLEYIFGTKCSGNLQDTLGSFESLRRSISEVTMRAVEEFGFKTMTDIQAKCIPKLLEGCDVRGIAKTGSGKTLAFLIPVVELVVKLKYNPKLGTGAIIISPTRELCMQTFRVLGDLMKYHRQTFGLSVGGSCRNYEANQLSKGITVLVATPGRLLDHLQNTPNFLYKNLACLVIDEADMTLDVGFEKELKEIVSILPKNRQTILFSATNDTKIDMLAKLTLKSGLIHLDVDCDKLKATTEGLDQGYVVCPADKRFLVLYTFIKKNLKKKVMVFFNSCMAVRFYHALLNCMSTPVKCIHGKQEQRRRSKIFAQFRNEESGVLLCTDVAARGWDIPAVDWIVQYDPPVEAKDYIHRVGRTARAGKKGSALLFLTESEVGFLHCLRGLKVEVEEETISWSEVPNIQKQLQKLVSKNKFLKSRAMKAFRSYFRAYRAHSLKNVFNVRNLDVAKVGKCFGFAVPPSLGLGSLNRGGVSSKLVSKRKRGNDHGSVNKKNVKAKRFRSK